MHTYQTMYCLQGFLKYVLRINNVISTNNTPFSIVQYLMINFRAYCRPLADREIDKHSTFLFMN